LRGRIPDANARELARFFTMRAAMVERMTVIDDREAAIAVALREALERHPTLVVLTGGLGPAIDDRTLLAVAEVLGRPLSRSARAKAALDESYARLRASGVIAESGMTAAREKMCLLPVGAEPIANPVGVAPGVVCHLPGGAAVLCLPGSPREARAMLEPALGELGELSLAGAVARREIEAPTADEAGLRAILEQLAREHPAVWVHSRPQRGRRGMLRVMVTLEAAAPGQAEAERAADAATNRLLALAAGSL
jgi:molybdopterin-biosynthesis enzyme MoeA-like protein